MVFIPGVFFDNWLVHAVLTDTHPSEGFHQFPVTWKSRNIFPVLRINKN